VFDILETPFYERAAYLMFILEDKYCFAKINITDGSIIGGIKQHD